MPVRTESCAKGYGSRLSGESDGRTDALVLSAAQLLPVDCEA